MNRSAGSLSRRIAASTFLGMTLSLSVGCGGGDVPAASVQSAQSLLDQAIELVDQVNYSEALPLLTEVIEGDGLDVDQYTQAVLLRARCYADAGDIEKAQADLAEAQMGDPNQAQLQLTQGMIFKQEGKTKEASRAFAAAKRSDSTITIPK